jgi:hypothetical protein
MSLDSDFVLIGTGLAPLVAANQLLAEGKSVLILNPDFDFFLEDSELPLDPLLDLETIVPSQLARSSPERVLGELRPPFPGSVELWTGTDLPGFHDPSAPHIRQRSRLWVASNEEEWEKCEAFFVESSDAGLNPQILEGLALVKRFPGFSGKVSPQRGVMIPKLCDVDVSRYRNGLLEFVRERLGVERIVSSANQIELIPEGLRFHSQGSAHTARIREKVLVYWTPKLSSWILSQAKTREITPVFPHGVRLWEEWSLVSRDVLDPSAVGAFKNLTVWTEIEGNPEDSLTPLNRLSVLRAGALAPVTEASRIASWASHDSFASLSELCNGFLKWDRFSIRNLKARALFEWESDAGWTLSESDPTIEIVCGCEGSLMDVVRRASQSVQAQAVRPADDSEENA